MSLALAVLASAAVSVRLLLRPALTGRTFRIGYEQSPPDQMVLPDGSPGGPTIEIISEAARRARIRLQWVHRPEGPEKALASGAVDLWPLFGDLPGRRSRFFIGKPWSSRRFLVAVPQDSRIERLDQLKGRVIGVRYPGTNEALADSYLPNIRPRRHATFGDIFRAVC